MDIDEPSLGCGTTALAPRERRPVAIQYVQMARSVVSTPEGLLHFEEMRQFHDVFADEIAEQLLNWWRYRHVRPSNAAATTMRCTTTECMTADTHTLP